MHYLENSKNEEDLYHLLCIGKLILQDSCYEDQIPRFLFRLSKQDSCCDYKIPRFLLLLSNSKIPVAVIKFQDCCCGYQIPRFLLWLSNSKIPVTSIKFQDSCCGYQIPRFLLQWPNSKIPFAVIEFQDFWNLEFEHFFSVSPDITFLRVTFLCTTFKTIKFQNSCFCEHIPRFRLRQTSYLEFGLQYLKNIFDKYSCFIFSFRKNLFYFFFILYRLILGH